MFFIFTTNFLCTIDVLLIALMEEYSLQYKVDITKRLLLLKFMDLSTFWMIRNLAQ